MTSVDADPFDLQRFVDAQAPVFDQVLAELGAGRKRSHWMWFVFPQVAGLGFSATAQQYAIRSVDEARAYLAHPVLGPRLRDSVTRVLAVADRSAHQIFGSPDDLKFRSCMTLFARVAPDPMLFEMALVRFFDGRMDPLTLARLPAAAVPDASGDV